MTTRFYLVALNGRAVNIAEVEEGAVFHSTPAMRVTSYSTRAEADAAVATLKLVPYMTPGQRLAAIFGTLSTADQATYQPLFAPIAALVEAGKYSEAAIAINAVAVPAALQSVREQMLAALK